MHVGSYFASFLLHALLLITALLWPSKPPLDLNRTVYQVSLVQGAPGGELLPSPVLGKQGDPGAKAKAETRPAPDALSSAPAAPAAQPPASAPPVPADIKAPEQPKAPEIPRPESIVKPVPQPPKPDAEVISPRKQEQPEPPKPPEKEAPKPEPAKPQEPPKPPKAEEAPKVKPAEPAKTPPKLSPEDALKAALADAQKQAGKERQGDKQAPPQRSGQAALSSALADMQRQSRRQGTGGGGGGEGDGPGGGGIDDVYAGLVYMAVRPQWSTTTFSSRQNLVVAVRIKLDPEGNILECFVERGSGNTAFDGSAINAVRRTKVLPKPPTPEQQDVIINFNSQDMGR